MSTVNVTERTFDDTVKQGIVLLDFWASWCGPCRMFAPVFEAAADELVRKVREIDMVEVRRELAEAQASEPRVAKAGE